MTATLNLDCIFQTIFNSISSPTLRHFHITCFDTEEQKAFVDKLSQKGLNQEIEYIIGDGNCLLIDQSPKELFGVIAQAFDDDAPSIFKNRDEFLKSFHKIIYRGNEILKQRLILCLRRAEILQDIEGSPIIADLFRGFGDDQFKKYVKVITLSTIPWPLMLSNAAAISPTCISLEYKPFGDEQQQNRVSAVLRLQERRLSETENNEIGMKIKFCKKFIKQCCASFEKNTTETTKLYSLICHVGKLCNGKTDPSDSSYNPNVVTQIIRELDYDLFYFNVSELLTIKKSKKVKDEEAMDSIPYYAKFVLIAAFCCSFNRRNTDLRFFDREREGRKRTAASVPDSNKFHETGPQTFSLIRLMGVATFIMNNFLSENDSIPNVEYLINRLCEMRFLTKISNSNNISIPKYRCDASSDFVRDIATSLEIDIADYLDGNAHDLVNKLQLIKIK